jgi:dynein light intermediate chain 2
MLLLSFQGKTSLIHRFLDRNEGAKQTLALEYTFGRRAGKSMVRNIIITARKLT